LRKDRNPNLQRPLDQGRLLLLRPILKKCQQHTEKKQPPCEDKNVIGFADEITMALLAWWKPREIIVGAEKRVFKIV